jgi:hypothetical protein
MIDGTSEPPPPTDDLCAPGLPGAAGEFSGATPPEYERAFSIVAFTMNRFVIDQVLRASRLFDNDIEAMVIFGALAHMNVAHLLTPGVRPSERLGADGRIPDLQPKLRAVRLRDLVQVTGRPRETVRRKLERLLAAGRVRRVEAGWVYSTDTVDPEMRAQGMAAAGRMLQTADAIRAALQDASRATQASQSR